MYATVLHKNYGDIAKELVRSHMFSSSLEPQHRPDLIVGDGDGVHSACDLLCLRVGKRIHFLEVST